MRCYVFTILSYRAELWMLTELILKKLEAFEMWVHQHILRVFYIDCI